MSPDGIAPTRDFSSTIRAGIRGRTIGIPDDFFFDDLDPDVAGAVDDARAVLDGLGARLPGVRLPWAGVADDLCGRLTRIESASFFLNRLDMPDVVPKLGELLRNRFTEGVAIEASDLHEIMVVRAGMRRAAEVAFGDVDLILSPTTRRTAGPMPLGHPVDSGVTKFTRVFAFTGQPCLTVPAGFDRDGMPIGFTLTARNFREPLLFRAGYAFQTATDWHRLHPPLL